MPVARRNAVAIWAVATGFYVVSRGIPFDRATQILIIVGAAVAFSVGTSTGLMRIFADWLPFFALLYAYDYSRGAADNLGRKVHVEDIYNLELSWFGRYFDGQTPSVWLQQNLYQAERIPWWEAVVALTYCSHFVAPWVIVGTLYVRDRKRWAMFARRIIVISLAALITYVVVPAAPPWYAAKMGLGEPLVRIVTRGWSILGLPIAGQLISLGQGVVNAVAAIPSLHAGMALTISMFFWPRVGPAMRAFFAVYVIAMVFSLVYGGEHYIIDALLGFLYAVAVEIGCRMWERRPRRR